jgi:Coenzyme PQQ synthesis protein D (PqqD)
MLKMTDAFVVPTQVMIREVGDETVILDLASGGYYGLDPVGARVWQLLAQSQNLAQVCQTMQTEYDVASDVIEQDVQSLVRTLIAKQLLRISD